MSVFSGFYKRGSQCDLPAYCLLALICFLGGCTQHHRDERRFEPQPQVTLTVLALSDFHGALYEHPLSSDSSSALGGLPWVASAIDSVRRENPNTVLLDGGDLFQGSWPVNASFGLGAVAAYNLLQVDASCVGNHEFDYGPGHGTSLRSAFETAAQEASFEWLTANVYETDDSGRLTARWAPEGVAPWTVIERAGLRIGLIGLSTEQTPQTTLTRNVSDLRFTPVLDAVHEGIAALRSADVDLVFLLGHLTGFCQGPNRLTPPEECILSDELAEILNGLPRGEIDLIVAGHEHRVMANWVDETVVLAAGSKGSALVRADLVVGPGGLVLNETEIYEPWVLSHTSVDPGCDEAPYPRGALSVGGHLLTPDEEAIHLIERLEAEAGSLCQEIGCAERDMYRSGTSESPVGNFTADALFRAFPTADLALQNSGGLRADISQGVITREQIYEVMPFENRLFLVEMSGEAIEILLRIGSSGAHGIFQISGGRYRFDPALTGGDDLDGDAVVDEWETDRLCWVEVGGAPLESNRLYQVVVSDFIFEGGDHAAPAFLSSQIISQGEMVRDVMMEYLQLQEHCIFQQTGEEELPESRIERGSCDAY